MNAAAEPAVTTISVSGSASIPLTRASFDALRARGVALRVRVRRAAFPNRLDGRVRDGRWRRKIADSLTEIDRALGVRRAGHGADVGLADAPYAVAHAHIMATGARVGLYVGAMLDPRRRPLSRSAAVVHSHSISAPLGPRAGAAVR